MFKISQSSANYNFKEEKLWPSNISNKENILFQVFHDFY